MGTWAVGRVSGVAGRRLYVLGVVDLFILLNRWGGDFYFFMLLIDFFFSLAIYDLLLIDSQVKAIGKTYHKGCLRCTECSNHLDSTRLTERDGSPFCNRCYGKVSPGPSCDRKGDMTDKFVFDLDHSQLYGPQGSGYALLGKAGG
jgi:LIM domain